MKRTLLIALLLHLAAPTPAAEEPTFMTVRGKLVHREDFSQPLPRHVGKPNGYAVHWSIAFQHCFQFGVNIAFSDAHAATNLHCHGN